MRLLWRLAVPLLATAAVLSGPSAAAASGQANAAASKRELAAALVDPRVHTPRLARSFLGLSLEYQAVFGMLGSQRTGINGAVAGLFRNLTRQHSGAPVLRVGGGSTDEAWWNPTHRPRPNGISYDIPQGIIPAISGFAGRTRSPLILGLNLAFNDPTVAVDWARAAMQGFGRGVVFEIGNEPDLYETQHGGTDAQGRPLGARKRPYRFKTYLSELRRFARALGRLRPRPRLAAPGASGDERWIVGLPAIRRVLGRSMAFSTFHGYAGHDCPKPRPPVAPTIHNLLGRRFSAARKQALKRASLISLRSGRALRLTETNSIACGGKPGVSDSFASALWGIDWLFSMASYRMAGVDFHASSPYYTPILPFPRARSAIAKPLYYAMLVFAEATRRRSRLIIAAKTRSRANVTFWAAQDPSRTVRIVVLNASRRSGFVRIGIRKARRSGKITRLTAPSLSATTGISLAGQTVPDGTRDGQLVGPRVSERVRRRGRGVYSFRMPAASAAILSVPRVPRR